MTGSFPASIKTGLAGISGTSGPDTEDQTTSGDATDSAAGDYGVEYTMQTGLTRYAPMQPVPPTKITATNTKPLYPTSSVSIATTILPIPKIQTTLTQSQTYSVSSMENTVCSRTAAWPCCSGMLCKFVVDDIPNVTLGRCGSQPNRRYAEVPQSMEGLRLSTVSDSSISMLAYWEYIT